MLTNFLMPKSPVGRPALTRARLALLCLVVSLPAWAQDDAIASLLLSAAWCQESVTSISISTTRLTFHPDGTLRLRKEIDLSNGSNNATNFSARWVVRSAVLVISEPNGGDSRLPIGVQGTGSATRLSLGNATYSVCR
jgi:hypothetical protein